MSDPFQFPDPVGRVPEPSARATPARPGLARTVWRVVLAAALGVAVAALGTATHRTLWQDLPVGLVIALALTASTALLCRAWSGLATLAAAGAGWVIAMQVLSPQGAGGDVLVTDPGAAIPASWAGVAWTWGGIVVIGIVAFLPRRWFVSR
ncbi:hypothetical protein Xcel_0964 [Xylanimonas cellulosilytica DSM 15894]|uniref:Uncharacterized protein n=1 Tax=Xylanimonas cellulosilytica (strain DSM 15894 / JCM 12276 / CECT 5975 / KCTC 9989 / LMG 20990 / NBRC 107835 / XIL07) TaxID=446471 RepID=D1BYS0_XYLCX|nr:hypothetical protein [Xylanimonas cellulosilytica]ACZ29995.1 hypothetical protein Xcel_0964 [Xylanimonas cellulosilytica DSM 15894]